MMPTTIRKKKTGSPKKPEKAVAQKTTGSSPSLLSGLQLIDEIIAILRKNGEPAAVLREAVTALNKISSFDGASLFLKNKVTSKYDEIVSINGGAAMLDFVSLSTGSGIAGLTASTRKPLYLPERSRSRHFDPERSLSSLLSIPLMAGEELIGVLNLGAKPSHAFSETAVQLFTALSNHLAIAIERYSLQRDLSGLEQQLEKALEKTEHFTRQMSTLTEIKGSHEERRRALNDVNNALAVIIGSIGTLLYQRSAVDQKMLSQLRRSEQAAVRISNAIGKLDVMISDSSDIFPATPRKTRVRN